MRNHVGSYYFPAFEIMMDELRDYRYYAEDMLHPSLTAQQIIFDKFTETLIDEDSRMLMKKVESIVSAASHRPLHPGSPDHIAFAAKMLRETEDLQKTAPFLDFSEELNIFQAALIG